MLQDVGHPAGRAGLPGAVNVPSGSSRLAGFQAFPTGRFWVFPEELTARDTDSNALNNYTLTYDAAGNMTDDGESYKYEYDVFYRLRKVKNQSNALVAEYRYNGLGHRIGIHEDTDTDGDVDGSDLWYYDAFDERWRHLARFRSSDSSPKEDFVPAQAGLDGSGGSSYIDLVVCRNKDADTAWTSASDGTLEERLFYCQNWRADVSAIVTSGGQMMEWVKYSAYGIPFGLPGGDTDSDGDCDGTDVTQVNAWRTAGPPSIYDVRGDIDLDGDVDATDETTINTSFQGLSLGRGSLSSLTLGNHRAYSGHASILQSRQFLARARVLDANLGRWLIPDPTGYHDTTNLYWYANDLPHQLVDPNGTVASDSTNCLAREAIVNVDNSNGWTLFARCVKRHDGNCLAALSCQWYCYMKVTHLDGTQIEDCPKKANENPSFNSRWKGCPIDLEELNKHPDRYPECALWHGGGNTEWGGGNDTDPPPRAGDSESGFNVNVSCGHSKFLNYFVTSGGTLPSGEHVTLNASFSLQCDSCIDGPGGSHRPASGEVFN